MSFPFSDRSHARPFAYHGQRGGAVMSDDDHETKDARRARELVWLRRTRDLAQMLGSERDPARLPPRILDAAVELTGADRGFLVEVRGPDAGGGLQVKVLAARGFRHGGAGAEGAVSRSIVERCLREGGQAVVTSRPDDAFLTDATSLVQQGVRSVMCVPLRLRGALRGVLNLDVKGESVLSEGELPIVDETQDAVVYQTLQQRYSPEAQKQLAEQRQAELEEQAKQIVGEERMANPMAQQMLARIAGREAKIDLVRLQPEDDIGAVKRRLPLEDDDLLGLVVVGERTLELPEPPAEGAAAQPQNEADEAGDDDPELAREAVASLDPNTYGFFHATTLDAEARSDIERAVASTIVKTRLQRAGYEPDEIERLSQRPNTRLRTVTEEGETETAEELQFIVPLAFMMLLWVSVMTGGQYLLMSTIEEKSSRVMEVLLSATSAMQLLTGKIIGQGLVGLSVLLIYVLLGLAAAKQFGGSGILQQLPFDQVPWLITYFIMAYFLFAALMAAVGSAVTEIREAQSLMGPIMTLLMLPLFLWFLIIDNPNSAFSITLSYIPFVTPFVMILRVSQTTDPVPMWQVISATAVGFLGVLIVGWGAVKIFRVGVLMYGKPPSLLGLMKWLRQA